MQAQAAMTDARMRVIDSTGIELFYNGSAYKYFEEDFPEEKILEVRSALHGIGDLRLTGEPGDAQYILFLKNAEEVVVATYTLILVETRYNPNTTTEYIIVRDALGPNTTPHPDSSMNLDYVNRIITDPNSVSTCIYPIDFFYAISYKFSLTPLQPAVNQLIYPGFVRISYVEDMESKSIATALTATVETKAHPNVFTIFTRRVPDSAVGRISKFGTTLKIALVLDDAGCGAVSEGKFLEEGWFCSANIECRYNSVNLDNVFHNTTCAVAIIDRKLYNITQGKEKAVCSISETLSCVTDEVIKPESVIE